jgi:hypothetical protein
MHPSSLWNHVDSGCSKAHWLRLLATWWQAVFGAHRLCPRAHSCAVLTGFARDDAASDRDDAASDRDVKQSLFIIDDRLPSRDDTACGPSDSSCGVFVKKSRCPCEEIEIASALASITDSW